MVSIYCLKCRGKKEVEGAQAVIMKNGRPAILNQSQGEMCRSLV